MGVEAGSAEPLNPATSVRVVTGPKTFITWESPCRALAVIYGGKRVCTVGCIGLGDCINSCAFNAINMGSNGYPVVNE